ncbi:MAG: molybdopterin-synthase adenylyltransferase MoeB [Chloroflexota bacterium]|nr:molybdopterin-synthase adenylyltransferase MoeB [Chloroflexota bacterium]
MPSIAQIAAQVRPFITEVQAEQVDRDRRSPAPPRIVDVREQHEWDAGHIPGAQLIPLGVVAQLTPERLPRKDEKIVLHCAAGVRSAVAAYQLQQIGYTNVSSMAGGFGAWRELGLDVEAPLGRDQLERYSRHLLIPEVGIEGQQKLLRSKVLVIGAGGLGSPSAYYLAAAGVGTLGIIDSDVVDATNLQRQILHSSDRIGEPKVESAKRTLEALNPDVNVVGYRERLTSANIDRILPGYDVVVDGADNFPTRYLLNDASVKWRKPVVHGSIYRFEGQVTVFKPFEGPCYRCLFHEPPPPEMAPSCAEAGVLGVLPGIIGTIQANEVLKLLLGTGEPLVGRYLLFDATDTTFREVKLRRDPHCPVCGEHPTITEYIDYEGFCAAPAEWRAEHSPEVAAPAR